MLTFVDSHDSQSDTTVAGTIHGSSSNHSDDDASSLISVKSETTATPRVASPVPTTNLRNDLISPTSSIPSSTPSPDVSPAESETTNAQEIESDEESSSSDQGTNNSLTEDTASTSQFFYPLPDESDPVLVKKELEKEKESEKEKEGEKESEKGNEKEN